jgi:subtilisin family serine protease
MLFPSHLMLVQADVITASIGRPGGFSDNPWALVASRLVDKGVVVTISAGNEGYTGPFYTSTGSNGHGVLSVAAINVTGNPSVNMTAQNARPMAAYFTSWGPTGELLLKPDIGAPGYGILSTVLNQSYDTMSGTSMAAPYIAGVAALYIGEHGGRAMHGPGFAKMLWQRITSSGRNVAWSADRIRYNRTAPPFQVGTGLVDAWKVVKFDTQVAFDSFSLGDTQHFQSRWEANVTNKGNETHTYNFTLDPIAGANIYGEYTGVASLYDIEPLKIVPNVSLPSPVRVEPGQTRRVK